MARGKYTRGPWRVEPNSPDSLNIESGRFHIKSEHAHIARVFGGISDEYNEDKTLYANARLIAASPNLLATLEAIREEWHAVGSLSISAVELMDAAIAKARGEVHG